MSNQILLRLVCSLFVVLLVPQVAMGEVLDRIVAVVEAQNLTEKKVEAQIITQSEVDEVIRPLLLKLRQTGEAVDEEKVRKRALDDLIVRTLRNQKASQLDIQVTPEDIDALMRKVEKDNHLPEGVLPSILEKQRINVTNYRRGLEDNLLQSHLISRVIRPLLSVSEEEVQNLYDSTHKSIHSEEIHLGQILLQLESDARPLRVERIRRQARQLAIKLSRGSSLESLAGQYSNDSSGMSGGDMGWFKRGELLPEMERAIFDQEEGAIIGPLRSPQGFHVFKIMEKRTKNSVGKGKIKVRARHILIKIPESTSIEEDKAAFQKIQEIETMLTTGGDFELLAKQHSQDSTAKEGGDLGWFTEGMMVPSFERTTFALNEGEVSSPVRTPFGWHLIRLDEKKVLDPNSLEAQHSELTERVLEAKIKSRYKQWLRDLRQRAFVEFR